MFLIEIGGVTQITLPNTQKLVWIFHRYLTFCRSQDMSLQISSSFFKEISSSF